MYSPINDALALLIADEHFSLDPASRFRAPRVHDQLTSTRKTDFLRRSRVIHGTCVANEIQSGNNLIIKLPTRAVDT